MERTLYLDVDDDAPDDEVRARAAVEMPTPLQSIVMVREALRNCNMRLARLDLEDWEMRSVEYRILRDEKEGQADNGC